MMSICSDCRYKRKPGVLMYYESQCYCNVAVLGRDPTTGLLVFERCRKKNERGDCPDFALKLSARFWRWVFRWPQEQRGA